MFINKQYQVNIIFQTAFRQKMKSKCNDLLKKLLIFYSALQIKAKYVWLIVFVLCSLLIQYTSPSLLNNISSILHTQ